MNLKELLNGILTFILSIAGVFSMALGDGNSLLIAVALLVLVNFSTLRAHVLPLVKLSHGH
ncbi:MAG: hypothetical protein GY765_41600 [bacterium]|nr:hypothetical protein [bacterium]